MADPKLFRALEPSEISVRVGQVGKRGVSLLLYKDARVDMNILDEVYGSEYWQRVHREVKDNMLAAVGVWNDAIKEWIWKWDIGTESNVEKEKGEASDSFKRACINLGIGRELYTAPFIFIPCKTAKQDNGRYKVDDETYDFNGAYIQNIEYEEKGSTRKIKSLVIADRKGNQIYPAYQTRKEKEGEMPDSQVGGLKVDKNKVDALRKRLELSDKTEAQIKVKYKLNKLEEMANEDWMKCMEELGENEGTWR